MESPSKMEIRMENAANMMKEMVARQVRTHGGVLFAIMFSKLLAVSRSRLVTSSKIARRMR